MQFNLLKTALKAEEDSFNRSVLYALNKIIQQIYQNEARQAILNIELSHDSTDSYKSFSNKKIIKKEITQKDTLTWNNNYLIFEHGDSLTAEVSYGFENRDNLFGLIMIDTFSDSHIVGHSYEYNQINDSVDIYRTFNVNDSNRIMLISAALSQLEKNDTVPIEKRLEDCQIDSLIRTYLRESNIDLEYNYGILNIPIDSFILGNIDNNYAPESNNSYRVRLFPFDMGSPVYYLVADFPNKKFFLYSKILAIIISIIIFVIIIIGCFIYSIRTILKQRKTSRNLTDFINNMTHEFKTPLSTIQLAGEAISKDEIHSDKKQLLKFNQIILSENSRMKNQIDKILQIATLEEGDYIIKEDPVNINELVESAAASMAVHVNDKKGQLITDLNAQNQVIIGDRVHLNNIILNLIDNSIKYSLAEPMVSIRTENIGNNLILSVKDNGIGIHSDDLKMVFHKYFRVSKGDIHDVKGFGLGLSYVKMMVEAHHGTIKINSALDKGTEIGRAHV